MNVSSQLDRGGLAGITNIVFNEECANGQADVLPINPAARERQNLREWSYVVSGSGQDYWTQFTKRKLSKYIARRGDRFNLVIVGSPDNEFDYYVIPWAAVSHGFTAERLYLEPRERWMVRVRQDVFIIQKRGITDFEFKLSSCKGTRDSLFNPRWS